MRGRKHICLILVCTLFIGMFGAHFIENQMTPEEDSTIKVTREQQHVKAMEEGANPKLGTTKINKDFSVDKNFVSHLPLVVIDIGKQEIPVTKKFTRTVEKKGKKEVEKVTITESKDDPFVHGEISIIDNDNNKNKLSDAPAETSKMKIKYRGNSSIEFEKKQFGIKMLDDKGNNRKVNCMGMGASNNWILNVSMIDMSLIRNYMSYNLGSSMFPNTPECKYCEVIFKDGNGYKYQGLYLMMEKIERDKNRVNIGKYHPGKDDVVSYLLCRDRKNENDVQLSTYGDQNNLTYGRISILYPKHDALDKKAFNYIQNDIDKIERVLYSSDMKEFSTWPNYLDTQSFVDYFVFNELFGNYDAGNNSTYMYRDGTSKLKMGPLWDYDGAMDNYPYEINNPENVLFQDHPWFCQLVKSKEYVSLLESRYEEMKNGIFSAKNLDKYIDDVYKYIGNAGLRDWSRWSSVYGKNSRMLTRKDSAGYEVDRKRTTFKSEVQRLKDFFHIKEKFMGNGLKKLEDKTVDTKTIDGSYKVVVVIILIFTTVVLIRRREMFN